MVLFLSETSLIFYLLLEINASVYAHGMQLVKIKYGIINYNKTNCCQEWDIFYFQVKHLIKEKKDPEDSRHKETLDVSKMKGKDVEKDNL